MGPLPQSVRECLAEMACTSQWVSRVVSRSYDKAYGAIDPRYSAEASEIHRIARLVWDAVLGALKDIATMISDWASRTFAKIYQGACEAFARLCHAAASKLHRFARILWDTAMVAGKYTLLAILVLVYLNMAVRAMPWLWRDARLLFRQLRDLAWERWTRKQRLEDERLLQERLKQRRSEQRREEERRRQIEEEDMLRREADADERANAAWSRTGYGTFDMNKKRKDEKQRNDDLWRWLEQMKDEYEVRDTWSQFPEPPHMQCASCTINPNRPFKVCAHVLADCIIQHWPSVARLSWASKERHKWHSDRFSKCSIEGRDAIKKSADDFFCVWTDVVDALEKENV